LQEFLKYKALQKQAFENEAGFQEHMEKSGGHGQVWATVEEDAVWYYQSMLQAALAMKVEEEEEETTRSRRQSSVKESDVSIKSPEKKGDVEDNPVEGSQLVPETPMKKPRRM